jgi:hypothetical protein
VKFGRPDVRGVPMGGDLPEEPQGIGFMAPFLAVMRSGVRPPSAPPSKLKG